MGVVYGAASLWQWKITPDEAGWTDWASQPKSWKGAMKMEGSEYVGHVSKALEGLDFADIEKRWDLAGGKPLLAKEGKLYISYLNEGSDLEIDGVPENMKARWFNPKTGVFTPGKKVRGKVFNAPSPDPWVLIIN